jgi:hypothetical protein
MRRMHKAGPTGEQALGTHTALEAVKRCQDAQQCWLAERLLISQERSTREPVDLSQALPDPAAGPARGASPSL